jgi:5,10-methylene-tetrahydrofolate dehydrogenase/methenyl tetrahydrofolate cyclohydrolase
MKAMLRGKFLALSSFIMKLKKFYTGNLSSHLKALEQKEANTPKRTRQQEIIKLRAEINQQDTMKIIQRINKAKSWFFEKINKIDKCGE